MADEGNKDNWEPVSYPIPEHWKYINFLNAFENISLNKKKVPQKKYLEKGKYPVVDQGEGLVSGYCNDPDKVISRDKGVIAFGDHTRCFKFLNFPFIAGADGLKVLCPNDNIDSKYAYFACLSIRMPNRGYSRHFSFLKRSNFPLAPVDEQQRLVRKIEEIFSELDDGIASLKKAREQLAIYRQSLLKHAFEGKLTAEWRQNNPDKLEAPDTLLARIQAEREAYYQQQLADWQQAVKDWEAAGKEGKKPRKPKKLSRLNAVENSDSVGLFELPKGWVYARLGNLIDEPTYGTSAKCRYESGQTGVLRIPNIINGVVDGTDLKYADFETEEYRHWNLKNGDILIVRSNGSASIVGTCAAVHKKDTKYLFAGYLIRLRPNKKLADTKFVCRVLSSAMLRRQIERSAKSTSGVNNINAGEIKSLIVPLSSSLEEQQEITYQLEAKLSVVDQNEQEIDNALKKAELLRQSILKKAFSGELLSDNGSDAAGVA